MNSFKEIAFQILKEAGKPLHITEITRMAKTRGLRSVGATPANTMEAIIARDIKRLGNKSRFIRTKASTFVINKKWDPRMERIYKVTTKLSPKQKGDIAENRIAEIILLYGDKLSCYKPTSDDEGIDLIVKKKGANSVYFVQVKSTWTVGGVVSVVVKKRLVKGKKNLGIVFCTFNTEEGEMNDYLWFVPAQDLVKRAPLLRGYDEYSFTSGRTLNGRNMWNDYLFDKRDLGNQIIKQMKHF